MNLIDAMPPDMRDRLRRQTKAILVSELAAWMIGNPPEVQDWPMRWHMRCNDLAYEMGLLKPKLMEQIAQEAEELVRELCS